MDLATLETRAAVWLVGVFTLDQEVSPCHHTRTTDETVCQKKVRIGADIYFFGWGALPLRKNVLKSTSLNQINRWPETPLLLNCMENR
jgi:hypothetical protein